MTIDEAINLLRCLDAHACDAYALYTKLENDKMSAAATLGISVERMKQAGIFVQEPTSFRKEPPCHEHNRNGTP